MPNGLLIVDHDGCIQLLNDQLASRFGYRREELLGQRVEMLVPQRFRSQHAALRDTFAAQPLPRPMGAGRELYGLCKDGGEFPIEIGLSPFTADGREMVLANVIDITERKRAEETEKLLAAELQHRTRNLFAIVQALAHRSLRGDPALDQAREAFAGRLDALARSDQRLTNSAWNGTSLNEVIFSELEHFAGRVKVNGPEVMLNPRAAQNFALAAHELGTNAAKYGALSKPGGEVTIDWKISGSGADQALNFRWRECGGPPVKDPKRPGFGTFLLESTLGKARVEYAPEGLSYEIDMSLDDIRLPRGKNNPRFEIA
jgi:PAS domain S-box-containing protein